MKFRKLSIGTIIVLILVLVFGFTSVLILGSDSGDELGGWSNTSSDLVSNEGQSQRIQATSSASLRNTSFADADTNTNNQVQRIVIKSANLTVRVDSPPDEIDRITALVEERGGWVVMSTLTDNGGAITVRAPAETFNQTLDDIKINALEVPSETITGEDVTDTYTDLESRLRNLELTENTLQSLLDEAESTEAVLAVFSELSDVRSDIEVIQGRLNFYDQSAAYSSITVSVWQYVDPSDDDNVTEEDDVWRPSETLDNSLDTLIDTFRILGDASIWLVTYILPLTIVLGIAWLPIRAVRRRWFKSSSTDDTSSAST